VFQLLQPSDDQVERAVLAASFNGVTRAEYLHRFEGLRQIHLPNGFVLDRLRTEIGNGKEGFCHACQAFANWRQFDLGWTRVVNSSAKIEPGQVVAVEVHSLGLWSLNLSRIVEVVDTTHSFGFIYKTTHLHVEEGEERFLLTLDEKTGAVYYETEAVSRPRSVPAILGYPVTRMFQHRFARASHQRMAEQ
jgi:uncharacterized protein (UPF0548 family)